LGESRSSLAVICHLGFSGRHSNHHNHSVDMGFLGEKQLHIEQ